MASRSSFLSKAYSAARRAGLPDPAARVAAAQAALESNYGKSAPGNNFFGIKAGKSWKGATQKLKTWEVIDGKKVTIKDSFRKYEDFAQSFKDWASLVGKRWPGVITAQTFEDAVAALKAGLPGGYATDPNYASKLAAMNARMGDQLGATLPDEMASPSSMTREQALTPDTQTFAPGTTPVHPSQLGGLNMANPNFSGAKPLTAGQQYRAAALAEYGQTRALNQQPPSYSPPNPGALRGRPIGALPSQLGGITMANPNFSGIKRGPLAPALSRPSAPPSNFAKGTMPTAAPKANRIGGMDYAVAPERFGPAIQNAVRPSLAPSGLPAARMQSTVAGRPATPAPTGLPAARAQTTVATRPNTPAPTGLPPAPSQASVMGALSQRAGLEAIKDDSLVGPVTAPAINPAIANLPNRPLHQVVPPVAMPTVLTNYPVANIPASQNIGPPRENFAYTAPTASDVYSGKASVGFDSVGNRVASIPGGTSVTNKYGATTGMVNNYQTAVGSGSMPSIPGMSMPSKSTVRGALTGAGIGASLGPLGALAGLIGGGALASAMANKNGTTGAATGQSGGGLGALFGSIFGGSKSPAGSSSGRSSGTSSKSGGLGQSTSGVGATHSKSDRFN